MRFLDVTIAGESSPPQTRLGHAPAVIELSSALDLYSAPRLRQVLLDLHQAGRCLLAVDMSAMEFMDWSGLGALLGAVKRARATGGAVVLVAPPDRVLQVLRITGVVRVLPVFATMGEALAHLAGVMAR